MLILYDTTHFGKERVGREKGSVGGVSQSQKSPPYNINHISINQKLIIQHYQYKPNKTFKLNKKPPLEFPII